MHNGTIRVESEHGRGSTFVILIPCRYHAATRSDESLVGTV